MQSTVADSGEHTRMMLLDKRCLTLWGYAGRRVKDSVYMRNTHMVLVYSFLWKDVLMALKSYSSTGNWGVGEAGAVDAFLKKLSLLR